MKCAGCQKEVGFNRCGQWCLDCIGGPLVDPAYRGFRPFMQAVGSRLNITEAHRDDIRRRKIDRGHGMVHANSRTVHNRVYRAEAPKSFHYQGAPRA